MPKTPPPLKAPFSDRRPREFLYLNEVDAIITATRQTRYPIRNAALSILLFGQALQPIEITWLRWDDVNFAENILIVERNRRKPSRGSLGAQLRYWPSLAVGLVLQVATHRCTEHSRA